MRTLRLADDSITVQRVIALTFAGEPIQVITVADGQQAMEKMAAHQPDIVLAGTSLPQVSGYELARFMRGKAELQKVPVLLLTGAFETVDEARLASSGANGILEKPVEPTIVINRVRELLGLKPAEKPAPTGRLITPAAGVPDRQRQAAPPRRAAAARPSPPQPATEPGNTPTDYLDTLGAAFDSLDQQLSGRTPSAKAPRNPAGPLGQAAGAVDPRSPGRSPSAASSADGNPVFEVDDEWFGGAQSQARADARAGSREIAEDLRDPELQAAPRAAPSAPLYEVDDE